MKEDKVFCQKQIGDNILIGKIRVQGKTKWVIQIANLARQRAGLPYIKQKTFRKSRFKNLEEFNKFLER